MNFLLRMFGLESGADVHSTTDGFWRMTNPLPPAVLWMIIIVGLVLAFVNFLPQISMRWSVRIGTCLLRLAMLAVLLAVVTGLEWHVGLKLNEQQDWVVLVDDSASMATKDVAGTSRFEAALADLAKLRDDVDGEVNLDVQTFSGAPLGEAPGQGPTLVRDAVVRAALSRQTPDRLVLLTDGRDSERRQLAPLGEELKARDIQIDVRLYGAKTAPVDAGISAEPLRSVIRLGEDVVVRGVITGMKPSEGANSQKPASDAKPTGEEITVTLKENGKEVKTVAVGPDSGGRFEIVHKPKAKGQHAYSVELPRDDAVAQNNAVSFTVGVVEEKINVLLIEGFPRYEFKLIKGILEVDSLVNLVSISQIPGGGVYVQGEPLHKNPEQGLIASQADLFKYDIIILRDVARSYFRAGGDTSESTLKNIVQFVTKRGGGLIVLGGQDVYRAGGYEDSQLTEILPFDLSDHFSGQPQFEGQFFATIPKPAYQHPILRLLPEDAENRERLASLRQLEGSNNVGRFKPLATPLLTRTVQIQERADKTVEKEVPVMGYIAVGEGKVLAAAVDTLWRWQLQPDFEDPPLTMMLANAIRYLAPAPGRKPGLPSVAMGDGTPQVGQELLLATELRDANYDPITGEDLQASGDDLIVTVTQPNGGTFHMYPRDLPEEPGVYQYRVPLDQPGPYKVKAAYKKMESTRELLAGAAAGEYADLSADREGMEALLNAAGSGPIAQAAAPGEAAAWLAGLDTAPAQSATERDLEVWNSPLVLILFLALVSADCYLRKRQGLV